MPTYNHKRTLAPVALPRLIGEDPNQPHPSR